VAHNTELETLINESREYLNDLSILSEDKEEIAAVKTELIKQFLQLPNNEDLYTPQLLELIEDLEKLS